MAAAVGRQLFFNLSMTPARREEAFIVATGVAEVCARFACAPAQARQGCIQDFIDCSSALMLAALERLSVPELQEAKKRKRMEVKMEVKMEPYRTSQRRLDLDGVYGDDEDIDGTGVRDGEVKYRNLMLVEVKIVHLEAGCDHEHICIELPEEGQIRVLRDAQEVALWDEGRARGMSDSSGGSRPRRCSATGRATSGTSATGMAEHLSGRRRLWSGWRGRWGLVRYYDDGELWDRRLEIGKRW